VFLNNLLNSSESELYHANNATSGDDNTAYDPLNRLAGFERGTLSSSGNNGSALDTVASPNASQSWNLNAVGDQSSVTTNGTTTTNSTNAKNELTTNGSNSLTFDDNGNETTDENGQTTTYDAWNRAITVKSAGGTTIASYSYDPTGRRITETTDSTGSPQTTDIYFSNQWQDIEERQSETVTRQNVWGLGYVNQLVERDDNTTTGGLGIAGSGLGERLYAQQDANWSVTSLVDTSGDVVERTVYSPYGTATFLSPGWAPTNDAYAQNVLFQGGRFESSTGNYVFQRRDYDPLTGGWNEADPTGYPDGLNRYQGLDSDITSAVDPSGEMPVWLFRLLLGTEMTYVIGRAYSDANNNLGHQIYINRSINTILRGAGLPPAGWRGWIRPDIADVHDEYHCKVADIYEIKTANAGVTAAQAQASLYIRVLWKNNLLALGGPRRAGTDGTFNFLFGDTEVSGEYHWAGSGAILYSYKSTTLMIGPMPQTVVIPKPSAFPGVALSPPGRSTAENIGLGVAVGTAAYLGWEGLKWGVAAGLAVETGGLSLAAAAATP